LGVSAWAGIDSWSSYPSPNAHNAYNPYLTLTSDPNLFYINHEKGVETYKTTNGGRSWQLYPEGLPLGDQVAYKVVNKVLYRTIDGGQSWQERNRDTGLDLSNVTAHPSQANMVFAYSALQKSLMKSADGGVTWASLPLSIFESAMLFIIPTTSGQLHVVNIEKYMELTATAYVSNDNG
jgi:photosystem II stability/assembly factor-like uncharacterized protein